MKQTTQHEDNFAKVRGCADPSHATTITKYQTSAQLLDKRKNVEARTVYSCPPALSQNNRILSNKWGGSHPRFFIVPNPQQQNTIRFKHAA